MSRKYNSGTARAGMNVKYLKIAISPNALSRPPQHEPEHWQASDMCEWMPIYFTQAHVHVDPWGHVLSQPPCGPLPLSRHLPRPPPPIPQTSTPNIRLQSMNLHVYVHMCVCVFVCV